MDLPFGTVNINFDQDPTLGIADAVYAPERVDEVYLDRLLAESSEHLSLLTAPLQRLEKPVILNQNPLFLSLNLHCARRSFWCSICHIAGTAGHVQP